MAKRPPIHRPHLPGARQHTSEVARGSAAERGYDARWRRYRLTYLERNPLCVRCLPRTTAATVVDHIKPHRGETRLFWDPKNHQPLCKSCHDRKTATEDRTQ